MKKGNLVEWTPRMLTPPYEQGNIGIVTELDKLLKKAKVHWIKKPHCFEKNGVWVYLRNITLIGEKVTKI